jgi:hypothetical protein
MTMSKVNSLVFWQNMEVTGRTAKFQEVWYLCLLKGGLRRRTKAVRLSVKAFLFLRLF